MQTPIIIKPHIVYKPWGGDHFNSWRDRGRSNKIGEIVLLSSIKEFKTYIETHDNPPMSFADYWKRTGKYIAKERGSQCGGNFPFLLKFLSTKEPLSIQVHPSTEDLKTIFNIDGNGKFESWFILESKEDSKVFFGLKDKYNKKELLTLNERERPLELFNQFTPQVGDIFCLEPGLIHGTSGSLLFFEIQQPSDFTYRIYDFGRKRKLHLKEAQKVVKKRKPQIHDSSEVLITSEFSLRVKKATSLKDYKVKKPFETLTYVGPPSRLLGSFGMVDLKWGVTVLFWKDMELSFESSSDNLIDGGSFETLGSMNRNEALCLLSSE